MRVRAAVAHIAPWYRHVTLCLVAGATSCSTTDLDDRAGQPAPRSALPRAQPGPPARYRPPVFVVPPAEPALQLRLLQPVDPGDQPERDETRVPQQVWPPQQNRLAEDRGVQREVYGVADVPVQAADDEVRGRCDGCRGTEPFDHEPGERGHQYGGPGHHQYGTEYPKRYEVGQWRTRVPVGDQPRNEPDDGTRGKGEEDRASGRGSGALHGCHPFVARWGRMVGALRPVDRGLQRWAVEAAGGYGGRQPVSHDAGRVDEHDATVLKEQGPVQSSRQVRLGASAGHDGDPVAEDAPDPGGVRRRSGYHHHRLHAAGG